MSSVSQFISPAAVPIGSIVNVADSVTDDLITLGSAEFLKTGKAVPYQTKYSKAAAVGLGSTIWGTSANALFGGSSGQYENIKIFAKGAVGYLRLLTTGSHSTPGAYLFTNRIGVGLSSPELIQYPPVPDATIGEGTLRRTQPVYCSASNVWAFLETYNTVRYTGTTNNSQYFVNLYTSVDGINWNELSIANFSGPSNVTTAIAPGLTATASSVIVMFNQEPNSSTSGIIYKVRLDNSGRIIESTNITSILGGGWAWPSTSANGYAVVGPDEGYIRAYNGGSAVWRTLIFTDAGYYNHIMQSASEGAITWDKSTSGTLVLATHQTSGNGHLGYGPSLVAMYANSTISTINSDDSPSYTSVNIVFTGTYFVYSGRSVSSLFIKWSTDGQTWTSPASSVSSFNSLEYGSGGTVFKNRVLFNTNSNANTVVVTMASNTQEGTQAPLGQYLAETGNLQDLVSFNSKNLGLIEQAVVEVDANFANTTLLWWNSTNNTPINTNSRFKVVNSRLFVISPNTNSVLTSTDGSIWSVITVTGLASVRDIVFTNAKWYACGGNGTDNVVNSTDLVTWVASTDVISASTYVNKLIASGTALIAVSPDGLRRSTDYGVTWNTMTITPTLNGSSASTFVDGGNIHIFCSPSAQGFVTKYTSSDNGATWSTTATNIPYLRGGASNLSYVPHNITKVGTRYYAIIGPDASDDYEVNMAGLYITDDLINFKSVTVAGEYSPSSSSQEVPGSIFTTLAGVTMFSSGNSMVVLGGSGNGYVGAQNRVTGPGYNGYVRIA